MSVQKLQTKAKAFGTFVSPTTGSILYVDPNHDDEAHHSPLLTPAEAHEAFIRGYIDDPKDAKAVEVTIGEIVHDSSTLAHVATERTAEHAVADADVSPQPSALDSRQSTAWADADRVQGGAEGYADGVRIADLAPGDADPDAPPAPARSGRRAART